MAFSMSFQGTAQERTAHYLEHAPHFRLGDLSTEASHPKTQGLSDWAKKDLDRAIAALKEVDLHAVQSVLNHVSELERLKDAVQATLKGGRKVFLCGCGATGRLSLKLEFLWRSGCGPEQKKQVVGFMAGGDVALIRSIESFEDHFDFGERQLFDLGFEDGDLMIGITEGGETSFVIGATEIAAKKSSNKPYFLYCNPSELLVEKVARSRRVIENPDIHKICLAFGPMALSGSTRMQATTVQLLAMASCLLNGQGSVKKYLEDFLHLVRETDFSFVKKFTIRESELYERNRRVVYSTDDFGMTILTDTTERSPTFSLAPFENFNDPKPIQSLCYFHMMGTASAEKAWEKLLLRPPRTLHWEQYRHIAGPGRIAGYDFSDLVFEKRKHSGLEQVQFKIARDGDNRQTMVWRLQELEQRFAWERTDLFFQHLLLKLLLNIHSTLIMGRLDRYEGNWMTWVKPSNGKLIDRAIRYIQGLAEKRGVRLPYERVAEQVFVEIEHLQPTEPIVLKVLEALVPKR